ncbi:MAG: hypothetical protein Q8P41_04170 [Pseudomonadota bacterium]|nr:hypothetical protein [Pseudomonadota bacterium]
MSRRLVALSLPFLALVAMAARKPDDPKHENHFKSAGPPTGDVVSFALVNAHAQSEFVLIDTKITNTTGDQLLLLKKNEAVLVLPQGPMPVKSGGLFGGPMLIPPNDTRSHTWKVDGESGFHVESVTLQPKGFYVGSNTGTPLRAPEFQLPASVNDFTTGPFSCKLNDVKQETKTTAAAFACTYNGKGVGIVEPKKIGVREPGGKEFANAARKVPRDVLLPGDVSKFTVVFEIPASVVDMQFATLQVLFRDALAESILTPVALADWKFELDAAKTAEVNK